MTEAYNRLKSLLRELFQLDQADLGRYRIQQTHFASECPKRNVRQQRVDQMADVYQKRHPGFPQGVGPAMLSPEVRRSKHRAHLLQGQAAVCCDSPASSNACELRTVPA